MAEKLTMEQRATHTKTNDFSCLSCRQRKIKCDRRNPCSNCTKTSSQCNYLAPVRGKRKRTKPPKESLHAKLRRYEDLLESNGVKTHLSTVEDGSDRESNSDVESQPRSLIEASPFEDSNSKLFTKDGSSRYFDGGLWNNVKDEIHSEEPSVVEANDYFDASGFVLGTQSKTEYLASLHPPWHIVKELWATFLDRVDYITRFIHRPTFWSNMKNAHENIHNIPQSHEALMFAFYYVSASSMTEDECQNILREQKSIISTQYKHATRQALANAGFLETSNLVTLQAYLLFMVGMVAHQFGDSFYILSGISVRLGRKMGLHRDGSSLGLSPFETEMRRRIWWHIVNADCLSSDFTGTKPSMDLFLSDTKVPLNIEDEDMDPNMTKPPRERIGITSMAMRLIKCEFVEFFRKVTPNFMQFPNNILESSRMTLTEKDRIIEKFENLLESKYLRYFDPSNSFHLFTSVLARAILCKVKLMAHNPRQFVDNGAKIPQKEQEFIFANATKLLEYVSLSRTNPSIRKYGWPANTGIFWETLVYVLLGIRRRKRDPEVDRIWNLIGSLFSNNPHISSNPAEPIYLALGKWTLQVWDECREGRPSSPEPEYIAAIRRSRKPLVKLLSKANGASVLKTDVNKGLEDATHLGGIQSWDNDGSFIPLFEDQTLSGDSSFFNFSNLTTSELEPNEWTQWERLFAENEV